MPARCIDSAAQAGEKSASGADGARVSKATLSAKKDLFSRRRHVLFDGVDRLGDGRQAFFLEPLGER